MKCYCDELPYFPGFDSLRDYIETKKTLEDNEKNGKIRKIFSKKLEEIHLGGRMGDTYKCTRCGKLWHIVEPDFPSPGGFLPREDFRMWDLGMKSFPKSPRKFPALERLLAEEHESAKDNNK